MGCNLIIHVMHMLVLVLHFISGAISHSEVEGVGSKLLQPQNTRIKVRLVDRQDIAISSYY